MVRVKGRIFKAEDRAGWAWHYTVAVDGVVVLADNTGDYEVIREACLEAVAVAVYVTCAGQRFKWSWEEAVDAVEEPQ